MAELLIAMKYPDVMGHICSLPDLSPLQMKKNDRTYNTLDLIAQVAGSGLQAGSVTAMAEELLCVCSSYLSPDSSTPAMLMCDLSYVSKVSWKSTEILLQNAYQRLRDLESVTSIQNGRHLKLLADFTYNIQDLVSSIIHSTRICNQRVFAGGVWTVFNALLFPLNATSVVTWNEIFLKLKDHLHIGGEMFAAELAHEGLRNRSEKSLTPSKINNVTFHLKNLADIVTKFVHLRNTTRLACVCWCIGL